MSPEDIDPTMFGWYGLYHGNFRLDDYANKTPGRRLRAFLAISHHQPVPGIPELMAEAEKRGEYTARPLRTNPGGSASSVTHTAVGAIPPRDPELPVELTDLAIEINEDIVEACHAHFDGAYYAGVDSGIEPVPDSHVELVIWALQRELDRETRHGAPNRRAVPLASFAPAIQRALAERRRLRFAQYGIGRAQWLANSYSLWDIPEDPDFVPRRHLRKG